MQCGAAEADRVGEKDDGALVTWPVEVVDERRVLGQEGVGHDVEGVLEQDDGGELRGEDEVRHAGRSRSRLGTARASWRRRVGGGRLAGALGGDVLAIARSVDVDANGMHGEPIENGGGDGRIAEVTPPVTQIDIGSNGRREFAVPAIDEVEEGTRGRAQWSKTLIAQSFSRMFRKRWRLNRRVV